MRTTADKLFDWLYLCFCFGVCVFMGLTAEDTLNRLLAVACSVGTGFLFCLQEVKGTK